MILPAAEPPPEKICLATHSWVEWIRIRSHFASVVAQERDEGERRKYINLKFMEFVIGIWKSRALGNRLFLQPPEKGEQKTVVRIGCALQCRIANRLIWNKGGFQTTHTHTLCMRMEIKLEKQNKIYQLKRKMRCRVFLSFFPPLDSNFSRWFLLSLSDISFQRNECD